MSNADVVRRFEDEFKNKVNHDIVDEVMAPNFVHHAPFPGLPDGPAGMKAIGQFVSGAISGIAITIDHILEDGDLVADRVSAAGTRSDSGERISWTENHIYQLRDGRIVEWRVGVAPPSGDGRRRRPPCAPSMVASGLESGPGGGHWRSQSQAMGRRGRWRCPGRRSRRSG